MTKSSLSSVAAIQCQLNGNRQENIEKVSQLIHQAYQQGARIIITPELLEGPYFCYESREALFALAKPLQQHPTLQHFAHLSKKLQIVLPISFFEKDGPHYYNSCAILGTQGELLGLYRKSHIPAGPGYDEKFYFRPGNSGFKTFATPYGCLGIGICWDQWFPECARILALQGADIIAYPTAIGSEPHEPLLHTKQSWQKVMVGHAVANSVVVVAANRIGQEAMQTFYGSSFIVDPDGEMLKEMTEQEEGVIVANVDLQKISLRRAAFGFFRDRRSDLYRNLIEQ